MEQPGQDLLRAFLAERDIPCPRCGYNLRGLQGAACPECGAPIELDAKRPGIPASIRRVFLITVVIFLIGEAVDAAALAYLAWQYSGGAAIYAPAIYALCSPLFGLVVLGTVCTLVWRAHCRGLDSRLWPLAFLIFLIYIAAGNIFALVSLAVSYLF